MGTIKRGVLGGFSGKVANVIGGSWKGIAYMRSQPLSVANPNTAAQVNQRTAFKLTVALAQILLVSIIKPCWDRFAQGMSGFNAFVRANVNEGVTDAGIQFADLITSLGVLTGFDTPTVAGTNGSRNLDFGWVDNSSDGTALGTDEFFYAAYNVRLDEWISGDSGSPRSDAGCTVQFSANCLTGDVIHSYLMFRSADGTRVTNSLYIQEVI